MRQWLFGALQVVSSFCKHRNRPITLKGCLIRDMHRDSEEPMIRGMIQKALGLAVVRASKVVLGWWVGHCACPISGRDVVGTIGRCYCGARS